MNRIFIGWDSRFPDPALVLAHSFKKHSSIPLDIRFLDKRHLADCYGFNRQHDPLASTEFTYSRFLVPYLCNYSGFALFVDNDMLCLGDVAELFAFATTMRVEDYALRVCKHEHTPVDGSIKMGGAVQTAYPRKNWSSLMLMNCDKLRCWSRLVVETGSGARLHRFQDIPDEQIGALPLCWNSLDTMDRTTKMIHWTSGMRWNEPENAAKTYPHEEVWQKAFSEYREVCGAEAFGL